MNYNKLKTIAVAVEKLGLDINGNRLRKLTFFEKDNFGVMQKVKSVRINEEISHLSVNEIISVWWK